jgi:hypothetical protein
VETNKLTTLVPMLFIVREYRRIQKVRGKEDLKKISENILCSNVMEDGLSAKIRKKVWCNIITVYFLLDILPLKAISCRKMVKVSRKMVF